MAKCKTLAQISLRRDATHCGSAVASVAESPAFGNTSTFDSLAVDLAEIDTTHCGSLDGLCTGPNSLISNGPSVSAAVRADAMPSLRTKPRVLSQKLSARQQPFVDSRDRRPDSLPRARPHTQGAVSHNRCPAGFAMLPLAGGDLAEKGNSKISRAASAPRRPGGLGCAFRLPLTSRSQRVNANGSVTLSEHGLGHSCSSAWGDLNEVLRAQEKPLPVVNRRPRQTGLNTLALRCVERRIASEIGVDQGSDDTCSAFPSSTSSSAATAVQWRSGKFSRGARQQHRQKCHQRCAQRPELQEQCAGQEAAEKFGTEVEEERPGEGTAEDGEQEQATTDPVLASQKDGSFTKVSFDLPPPGSGDAENSDGSHRRSSCLQVNPRPSSSDTDKINTRRRLAQMTAISNLRRRQTAFRKSKDSGSSFTYFLMRKKTEMVCAAGEVSREALVKSEREHPVLPDLDDDVSQGEVQSLQGRSLDLMNSLSSFLESEKPVSDTVLTVAASPALVGGEDAPRSGRDIPVPHKLLVSMTKTLIVSIEDMMRIWEEWVADGPHMSTEVMSAEMFKTKIRRICGLESYSRIPPHLMRVGGMDSFERGFITFEEFARWSMHTAFSEEVMVKDKVEREMRRIARKLQLPLSDVEMVKRVFDEFDANGTGEVEAEGFKNIIVALMKVKSVADLGPQRLERYWREVNTVTSGAVTFPEFLTWYVKEFQLEHLG
eukprot:TRINITY_DN45295_c0_g1_i1.p1 TRINITY_DN45295_c0_g1~~TRINITY_DN45295_c0_g1_i1.p1  ORF type:complete len:715 (+),score=117.43 TRINITY_DN45295_c0_g1_i1:65-2209(+)